jgi:hypothetical protein
LAFFIDKLAVIFFWILGIAFFSGMIGCAFVIVLTTLDDLKDLMMEEEEKPSPFIQI